MTEFAPCKLEVFAQPLYQPDAQPSVQPDLPQAKGINTTHLGAQVEKVVPSCSNPKQVHFQVGSCNGRNFPLMVSPFTSVKELKVKIEEKTGILAKSQILYVNNKTLEDGKILNNYQLKGINNLLVVHKVWGG
ncbi:uncharacterized protein [Heterodontus francisci]|uniref:uncharacterized protein n=1 Tax=Heterodontus francisci TaxID=7792 RepID=UPI00355C4E1A